MQIEIEKKYNLTKSDYQKIKDHCSYEKTIELKDYYLDKDFILTKNNHYLRLRNGRYELKIIDFNTQTQGTSSEEYDDEDEINLLLEKFSLTTDDVIGIMFVETKREKYHYNYKGQDINIDIETYQYGTRYEIEIMYQAEGENLDREKKEIELNGIIENFRVEIGLDSESNINSSKTITCAMHQNIELYEIMTQNIIK